MQTAKPSFSAAMQSQLNNNKGGMRSTGAFLLFGGKSGPMERIDETKTIPIGTVISYGDQANDRRKYVVTSAEFESNYHGQQCFSIDADAMTHVSLQQVEGLGGWKFEQHEPLLDAEAMDAIRLEWSRKQIAENIQADKDRHERDALIEQGAAIFHKYLPKGATSVIIARLEEDASDLMTDYFSSRTVKSVVLAFSTHDRNDFNEFRNAALLYEPTKHLAADKSFEHRENYTGGNGYYLGSGRYSGWQIKKAGLNKHYMNGFYENTGRHGADYLLPMTQKAAITGASDAATGTNATVLINEAKNGIEIKFSSKPEQSVIDKVKGAGFRWSKFGKVWYKKRSDAAELFAHEIAGTNKG